MTTTKAPGRFSGRTKLITIASIVAVGIAGAGAVSANIGILNAADNTNVGTLSAAGDLATPNTQVIDVYLNDPTTTATAATTAAVVAGSATPDAQQFAVDAAGTVAVAATGTGLRLDSVTPAAGWTWSLAQSKATELAVTFTNGARTLEFVAVTGADGKINATVSEPIVTPATAAPASGGQVSHGEYEGGGDDD